jgi:hypothetical protein
MDVSVDHLEALSRMASPCRASCSVVVHGGTTWGAIEVDEGPKPELLAGCDELVHRRRGLIGCVEGYEGLPCAAVTDQLDCPEHAKTSYLSYRRMPVGEFPQCRADNVSAKTPCVFDDCLILEDVDRGDRGCAGEGCPE